jgi:hypothetical protein
MWGESRGNKDGDEHSGDKKEFFILLSLLTFLKAYIYYQYYEEF